MSHWYEEFIGDCIKIISVDRREKRAKGKVLYDPELADEGVHLASDIEVCFTDLDEEIKEPAKTEALDLVLARKANRSS